MKKFYDYTVYTWSTAHVWIQYTSSLLFWPHPLIILYPSYIQAMQDGETYEIPTNAPPPFSSHTYSDNHDDTKLSDNSDNDSISPFQSSSFGAPPIRTAVLKKLFPDHQPSGSSTISGSSSSNSGAVTTRTVFTGTVGSTRTCLECDAINSKMAKKCQQCKAPLQV